MKTSQNNRRLSEISALILAPQAWHRFRHFLTIGKWIFTILAVTFLIAAVWQSRFIIRDTLENSIPLYLFLAILSWFPAYLLSPFFVVKVLKSFGTIISYRQMLNLHLRYLPARYLPGGIWFTVAKVRGLQNLGVHPGQLSSLVILEHLIGLGVSLTAGGIVVGLHQSGRIWQPIAFLAALISLIIIGLCPVLMHRLPIKTIGRIFYRDYVSAVFITILFWFFASASFLLFISALPGSFIISAWLEIVGAYLFSWGIGFIAIFAPQGVGVFEVVAADIMPTKLPFSALVALLAGFRVVIIIADLLMWAIWISLAVLKNFFRGKKAVQVSTPSTIASENHPEQQ